MLNTRNSRIDRRRRYETGVVIEDGVLAIQVVKHKYCGKFSWTQLLTAGGEIKSRIHVYLPNHSFRMNL